MPVDADRLLALLGQQGDSPAVEAALSELRTRRRPELDPDDRGAMYDWVLVRRQGVELGFADRAFFNAEEKWKRRRDPSALIMFQVYFYSAFEDVSEFTGQLPFRLRWTDSRKDARSKLQRYEGFRRSYRRDTWQLPEFWLTLTYKKGFKAIDSIVCQLEPRPWPEAGRVQPTVPVEAWLDLLGQPASSAELRRRLRPLDVLQRIADDEDDEDVDFRYECGLELLFTPAGNLKGPYRARRGRQGPDTRVLGAVRFFRSRELDARQWTGELPFGLEFDDTQRSMIKKVGRKPDEQGDDDLDGYALWRFGGYSLHVMYDNMKNRLLRISIAAPGFDA